MAEKNGPKPKTLAETVCQKLGRAEKLPEKNVRKKTKYYLLYINKMKYLEENYRKTKIYTDYHRQLEGPEPVIATAIDPSAPDYAL